MAYNPNALISETLEELEKLDLSNLNFSATSLPLDQEDIADLKQFISVAKENYDVASSCQLYRDQLEGRRSALAEAFQKVSNHTERLSCLEKFMQEANPELIETGALIMCANIGVDSYLKGQLDITPYGH